LESKGIVTVTLNLFKEIAETVKPPRSLYLRFPYGSPVGKPNDREQQLNVITEALELLETASTPGIIKDSSIRFK
jgi:D-proline reductase (dithiol) PrdB